MNEKANKQNKQIILNQRLNETHNREANKQANETNKRG